MNDWNPILNALAGARSVLLTSHVSPDGDSLGSLLALAGWLSGGGRTTRIVNADPVPARYRFLDPDGRIETFDPARHAGLAAGIDLVVVLDVSRLERLGAVADLLRASPAPRLCIDHHPGEPDFDTTAAIVDPTRAATAELLVEMMEAAGAPPGPALATPLWVAVMTDTGSFRYGNTTPRTLRIAASLLEQGVDVPDLYDRAYGLSRDVRFRLMGQVLAGYRRAAGGAAVIAVIDAATLRRFQAEPVDAEGMAELLRGAEGCRVSAVFTEVGPDRVKVNLRSRGRLDVNAIARRFGGGGHANAAGISTAGELDDVVARVTRAIEEACLATPDDTSATSNATSGTPDFISDTPNSTSDNPNIISDP